MAASPVAPSTKVGNGNGGTPWKFHRVPQVSQFTTAAHEKNFWKNLDNHKDYFDQLSKELNFASLDDWYNISLSQFCQSGRSLLNSYYQSSYIKALQSVYPEKEWKVWRFSSTPKGYWQNSDNQKDFFRHVAHTCGIKEMQDWYKITKNDIAKAGGGRVLSYYKNSPALAIQAMYPNYDWLPWLFTQTPKTYWDDIHHRRKYFKWLEKELGVNEPEDWYSVNWNQKRKMHKGGALSTFYNDSLVLALPDIYPEIEWDVQKFLKSPNYYWQDLKKTKKFLARVEAELEIHSPEDWYRISHEQFSQLGGETILRKNGGLFPLLSLCYPTYKWDQKRFQWLQKKSTQRILFLKFKQLLKELTNSEDDLEVFEDYSDDKMKFPDSGSRFQLDIFVPSLNVAIEYQGVQHYKDTEVFGDSIQYSSRDTLKKETCKKIGITLIEIPYWWSGSLSSLREIMAPFSSSFQTQCLSSSSTRNL